MEFLQQAVQNKTGSTVLNHFYFVDEILLASVGPKFDAQYVA